MLKVLIVDDDIVSRTNLKTLMDWEHHGFYITGEAENGLEAIKMMERETPDIVITDMSMPFMDGIQLIDHIEKHFPQVRIITLSAYDDFEYVRQSMKKGAVDYVLKHRLSADLMLEILKAAEQSVHERHEIDRELSISKSVQRREFLRRLLEGDIAGREEACEKWDALGFRPSRENLVVAVVEIDDFSFLEDKYSPAEMHKLLMTFLDISGRILQESEKAEMIHLEKGKFAIVLSLDQTNSQLYVYTRLHGALNRIRTEIPKYLNITACFGVSGVCRDVSDLPRAYREAEAMLEEKFYQGKNSIFMKERIGEKKEQGFLVLDIREEKAILSALRNGDYESAEKRIDGIFAQISNLRPSHKSTQMICAELINIANKVSKDAGIGIAELYESEESPYQVIQKHETLEDLKAWVLGRYRKLTDLIQDANVVEPAGPVSDITQKAIAYIRRHYDKDFSLADAAREAGVSPSYLSRLFKEECGMGFTEYLNRFRVERAKRLIEEGEMKLKEIVHNVGFNQYNYFFKVFKEMTGMTPHEYELACKRDQKVGVD